MNQARIDSFMEALTNVAIGFIINFVANWFILPLFLGIEPDVGTFAVIGIAYTLISVARSYAIRRAFNGKSVWRAMRDGWWNLRQRYRRCQCVWCLRERYDNR